MKSVLTLQPRLHAISSLVPDGAKLVDVGTHAQLLERCDDYRKMVELQKLEEEGGVSNA